MLKITMVGCGAIGRSILDTIEGDSRLCVTQIIALADQCEAIAREFPGVTAAPSLEALPVVPELLIECAGHAAVVAHVLPALERGIDCVVCSIGALAEQGLPERIEAAASLSGAQAQLVSGAIGAIDALAAARIGGLTRVVYTGRKPPQGWKGTPAEDQHDLDHLEMAVEFFSGSAREAARLFPKNANVAATTSLAGLGFDATEVHLIADPAVTRNQHHLRVEGSFGELEFKIAGKTLPSNPKTSALTVYSAVRALRNYAAAVAI